MISKFNQFVNEEAAPRIPNSPEYWINKKGKIGKDVMIYTHDDLDGIFSGIAIKKYLKDHGFNIIGYGVVNYQESWRVVKIDPTVINVAVDFAETHPDIDVYIDHHGEFIEGDEMTEDAIKKGAIKTKTGSAYEGIMDQLGLPVDSLVLDVIDMVDSAKYDTYGVKWPDLLNFNLSDIINKHNAKLVFAGAFNQLIKRGDEATIMEIIANVDEPSIYKIFNYMKKLYPGNNPQLPKGTTPESFTDEYVRSTGKSFLKDAAWRMKEMKKRAGGTSKFKGIIRSQQEFKDTFTSTVYNFAGSPHKALVLDGYCVIGDIVFFASSTWANAIRVRAIIEDDINKGRLPKEANRIKWVLLQYGDTLQLCTYKDIKDYKKEELPVLPGGKKVDDLKTYCIDLLEKFKVNLMFNNPKTIAGGHPGIGSISNIGIGKYVISAEEREKVFRVPGTTMSPYIGLKYIDLFKNYIIASLSKVPWKIDMSWDSPQSENYTTETTPINAKVMKMQNIRKINKESGEIEYPEDYKRRPSMMMMKRNEEKLKRMEDDLKNQIK